jgi:PBSX family phage terminase large subunit
VSVKLTKIQQTAWQLLASAVKHVLLVGGSRSGKTFIVVRAIIMRAMLAPGSRHLIVRFRFNHVKASIILDTLPKVMNLCWPGMPYEIDKTDWYLTLPNGAQVWFGGLDDKERTEKILGQEYATIFFNECSQIPLSSRNMAMTRLAQKVDMIVDGVTQPMRLKAIYDENPPSMAHWTYRMFVKRLDPESGKKLADPEMYGHMFMNPADNIENLPPEYLRELANMPVRMRQRFYEGKFADTTVGALWTDELIEKKRHLETTPDLVRIVVAVDPSGSDDTDNASNDEIGIVCAGLGVDGRAYCLEDVTIKAGPATWGNMAVTTYDRHEADIIVGEKNYGGAMVKFVVQSAARANHMVGVKYKEITATRGKVVRAEPISALTEQDKIRFAGYFPELEDELCGFTTHGYTGERSPNRADAFMWAMSELFPGIIRKVEKPKQIIREWSASDPSMAY